MMSPWRHYREVRAFCQIGQQPTRRAIAAAYARYVWRAVTS